MDALLGPLEVSVFRALWAGAPATVATVRERVNDADGSKLAHTTIMTVLGRLFDKGLLDRHRQGRGYAYTPRFTEPELVDHLGRREVDTVIDRYGDAAIAAFAQRLEDADPELRARLRRLVEGS